MTMRRLILSFVVAGVLAVISAAPAAADPVLFKPLPDAACDAPGTHNAGQQTTGTPGRPHVPHEMDPPSVPGGAFCMTMPGANPGQR